MNIEEVYVKGDAHTPQRFWEIAFRNTTLSPMRWLMEQEGFVFSQKLTDEYKGYSDEQKKKVRFNYINGEPQTY